MISLSQNRSAELLSRFVNRLLTIKPLARFAKRQARNMMIKRAAKIGVFWQQETENLRSRGQIEGFAPKWDADLDKIRNQAITYPTYYLKPFHAYEEGNLGWQPAMEVEVAAKAVHAKIWPEAGAEGDQRLRHSYHQVVQSYLPWPPQKIVDLGCSVGMSTFALQEVYPQAQITGVDLSPYFLAVANYREQQRSQTAITWVHAAAESTGLVDATYDLVSACLVFHELPQQAAKAIFQEAYRLLQPGGHFSMMDMNPKSAVFAAMPPYIFTLLKSTEPYLDEYLTLDCYRALQDIGFEVAVETENSSRHRTLIARKPKVT